MRGEQPTHLDTLQLLHGRPIPIEEARVFQQPFGRHDGVRARLFQQPLRVRRRLDAAVGHHGDGQGCLDLPDDIPVRRPLGGLLGRYRATVNWAG